MRNLVIALKTMASNLTRGIQEPSSREGAEGFSDEVNATQASSSIGRNTFWNVLGTGLPMVLALVTIPVVIHSAGAARFGVLTIAWAVLGYFGNFDLGLGGATIRFLAEAFEHRRVAESRGIFWTSVLLSGLVGAISACLLAALTPWLVGGVLNVPLGLRVETQGAFYFLAMGVPLTTVTSTLRGTLEAKHRFGLVNALQVPNSALTQAAPLLALIVSQDLRWLVGAMVLSRAWGAGVFLVAALQNLENPFEGPFFLHEKLRVLLSYSAWQAITNSISPLMANADRFVIGAITSMTTVAYYATPAEFINRLGIIPQSLARTTFPIFSAGVNIQERSRVYIKATKYLALVLVPLVATIVVFAPQLLGLWVGPSFAQSSARVMQILAVGLLLNSLASLPFGLIQGIGRPDITAKFHMFELPLYILLLWYGTQTWGITGTAVAWTLRVGLDFLLLILYVQWTNRVNMQAAESQVHRIVWASLLFLATAGLVETLITGLLPKLCVWGLVLSLAALAAWRWLLMAEEKNRIAERVRRLATMDKTLFAVEHKGTKR